MTDAFRLAWRVTSAQEGGFSDNAKDPGGKTLQGITEARYHEYLRARGLPPRDVRESTPAEREAIAHEYWAALGCDDFAPAYALCVFDAAFNSGPGYAKAWHAKAAGSVALFTSLRLAHLASLSETWPVFGRGWTNRVATILSEAAKLEQPTKPEPARPRVLVTLNPDGSQASAVEVGERDVLIRLTSDRVYVRPD